MSLSNNIISQFVKVTNDNNKKVSKETITYAKVETVTYGEDNKLSGVTIRLDGSTDDIEAMPASSAVDVRVGDTVIVMIKNHRAVVTGNLTTQSANMIKTDEIDNPITSVKDALGGVTQDNTYIKNQITHLDTLVATKVDTEDFNAETGRIDDLLATKATIEDLRAVNARIDNLDVGNLTVEDLDAKYAQISELNVVKERVGTVEADNITINQTLSTASADIETLQTENATVKGKLEAAEGDIADLETKKLDAESAKVTYANIDFSNIGEAAMKKIFADSGLIREIIIGDGTITGELVGVTISGDLIEGNTIIAEKLVVKGEDGLYYKLNTDGVTTEAQQTDYNSLNGSVIKAKSITATKISVDDLVAFDATIGGFNITEKAIYSGVKNSATNTARGVYLDSEGQLSVGDSNNFLRYYKDSDENYKLELSASSVLMSASNKSIETAISEVQESVDNIQIGGRNLLQSSFLFNGDRSTEEFTASGWGSSIIRHDYIIEMLKPSETYTISYNAELIERTEVPTLFERNVGFLLYSYSTSSAYRWLDSDTKLIDVGDSVRVERTFTMPDVIPDDYIMLYYTNRFTTNGSTPIGLDTVKFTKLQIEKGNKVTDYTPAIEDLQSQVDVSIVSVDVEYYLSSSATELLDGVWQTTAPEWVDGKYMWSRTTTILQNGTSTTSNPTCIAGAKGATGAQGIQGEKGDTGETGAKGDKGDTGESGKTSYFHIKYSSVVNPTSSSQMTDVPDTYIGTYVDFVQTDSTDPSDYTWSQFQGSQGEKGDQGIAGTNGTNGQTSYLHIAYADDDTGTSGFSVSDSTNKLYIGQYTDFTSADSTDPTKYSWTKIKGDTGDTGATGTGIASITEEYYVSTSKTSQTGGSWSTTTPTWSSGTYIWTRSKIVYKDPASTVYTTPICDSSWEAVNEIDIGGRNLVPIKAIVEARNVTTTKSFVLKDVWATTFINNENLINILEPATQYTIKYNIELIERTDVPTPFDMLCGFLIYSSTAGTWIGLSTNIPSDAEIGTSKTVQKTFVTPDEWTDQSIICYSRRWTTEGASPVGFDAFQVTDFKIEKGNKATDWTPAPEDMATADSAEDAKNSAESANTKADEAKSLILELADSISMLVTDGNGTSLMTQTEDGWTFSTANIQSSINSTSEGLSNLQNTLGDTNSTVDTLKQAVEDLGVLSEYVKITTYEDEPCIELGDMDSDFKLLITNTRILFKEGSTTPAYITNQSLHIEKAVVEEELQQGEFVWKTRSNGNLGLTWKGGNS